MAEYDEVKKIMLTTLARYPHGPELQEPHFKAYYQYLRDLPADTLTAAALKHSGRFYPSASELRDATFELTDTADGTPNEDDAWAEVHKSFGPIGTLAIYRGLPDWSHPLIGYAIDAVGGYMTLCTSDNAVADRAHFKQAYRNLSTRHRSAQRALPEVRAAIARLAASRQPQLGAGD